MLGEGQDAYGRAMLDHLDVTGWRIDRLEHGPAGRYSALLLKDAS
jgi:hypothetical protein